MTGITPHPVLWSSGQFSITAHGLFFALGAEACYLVLLRLAKSRQLNTENLAEKVAVIFFAGLVAARIGYFISYPSAYQSVVQVFSIWHGGLVSFWGIIGGLGAAWFLFRERRTEWLGLLSVATLLAWAVGRLGNFWAGDSFGVLSPVWGFFYGRVPIQLFEALLCLLLFFFWLRRLDQKNLLVWVLLSYLAARFLVDFWRDESVWAGLHVSQWTSLVLAVPLLSIVLKREKR